MPAEHAPDAVGDELRTLYTELEPLAKRNASKLQEIHRRAQAKAPPEQRQRIVLSGVTRVQRRAHKERQQILNALQPPRAPKRKQRAGEGPGLVTAATASGTNLGGGAGGGGKCI